MPNGKTPILMENHDMVLEEEALPLYFIDMQELDDFGHGSERSLAGVSYEWEGEQVIHLRTHAAHHAYGRVGEVLFTSDTEQAKRPGTPLAVLVLPEGDRFSAQVFRDGVRQDNVHYIPAQDELYSRNKGILELSILEGKTVAIVGLGSFGSQIAIELAKAGVGNFKLLDFDRVELHNLARHTCTASELGRLKTDAIADAIWGKNPYAQVEKYPVDINKNLPLLDAVVRDSDLVIVATDNNTSRFNINDALVRHGKVGIYGRAITRAEGGDVFRYRPGGPCYTCLVGNGAFSGDEEITNEDSARRSGQIPAYMSAADAQAVVQVGLSTDIQPICNLMVKLALVELSRGAASGISSLEDELVYDYYMWANRRENKYLNWHAMPGAGPMPTILRWYGARIDRNDHCVACAGNSEVDISGLDQGGAFAEQLNDDYEGLSLDIDQAH